MAAWWTIRYWRLTYARLQQREHLALRLWPFLPAPQRAADDSTPLKLLGRMTRAIEAGDEQFVDDNEAHLLWRQARADSDVQQTAGALRTLRLQLDDNPGAAGLQVAPFSRAERKRLRKAMFADEMDDGLRDWLQAPLMLPLLSVVFLLSGWFFNSIFLGRFGLEVGRYFGLSDYLASSIEGLMPAAPALVITFVAQWFMRNRTRLQALQQHLGLGWINMMRTVSVFLLASLFFLFMQAEPEVRRLALIYLLVLVLPLVFLPLLFAYSKQPSRVSLLVSFVVVYSAVIWFVAEMRALQVQRPTARRAEVVLASVPEQTRSLRVLSGNSLYLFLLEDNGDVLVVPVEQVVSVRYRQPDPVAQDVSTVSGAAASDTAAESHADPSPLPTATGS